MRHLHFFCADLWWISTSTTTKILSEDPGNGQTVRHLYIFSSCHVAKSEVVFQAGRRILRALVWVGEDNVGLFCFCIAHKFRTRIFVLTLS